MFAAGSGQVVGRCLFSDADCFAYLEVFRASRDMLLASLAVEVIYVSSAVDLFKNWRICSDSSLISSGI